MSITPQPRYSYETVENAEGTFEFEIYDAQRGLEPDKIIGWLRDRSDAQAIVELLNRNDCLRRLAFEFGKRYDEWKQNATSVSE